jgi:hypothetical protein
MKYCQDESLQRQLYIFGAAVPGDIPSASIQRSWMVFPSDQPWSLEKPERHHQIWLREKQDLKLEKKTKNDWTFLKQVSESQNQTSKTYHMK